MASSISIFFILPSLHKCAAWPTPASLSARCRSLNENDWLDERNDRTPSLNLVTARVLRERLDVSGVDSSIFRSYARLTIQSRIISTMKYCLLFYPVLSQQVAAFSLIRYVDSYCAYIQSICQKDRFLLSSCCPPAVTFKCCYFSLASIKVRSKAIRASEQAPSRLRALSL